MRRQNWIRDATYNDFDDFCRLFDVTGNGSLRADASLITGIPLEEVHFIKAGLKGINKTNENKQTLLHIYAVAYGGLLRMASTLNRTIPDKYRPRIAEVHDEDEEKEQN